MKETKPTILEVRIVDGVKTATVQDPTPEPRTLDENGVDNQIRILGALMQKIQAKLDYYTEIKSGFQVSPSPADTVVL